MIISRSLKCIFILSVFTLILFNPQPGESSTRDPSRAPVNPVFLKYLQELQDRSTSQISGTEELNASEGFDTSFKRTGAIPSLLLHPKPVVTEVEDLLLAGVVLPSAYDLRDEGLVTPVRDQHAYGTCWTFGAMGSIESYLKRSEITRDLSEYHLAWWAYNGSPSFTAWDPSFGDHPTLDQGGNAVMALAMLSRWSGAVNENDCPYDEEGEQPLAEEDRNVVEHVQNAYYIDPSQTSVIKQALMEYGAVNMMIIWNDSCYNEDNASYYMPSPPAGLSGLHSLVIVGWDNNYSRYRFSPSAPVNGAWLVRNSWGSDWGEDGYFWLSYANTMTEQDEPFIEPWVFLSEPSRNYTKNYQYDPLGWVGNIGYYDGSDYFANIFTASGKDLIEAVSFYTPISGSSYEIRIFTDLARDDDPRSGEEHYHGSGTLVHAGYHTISLTDPISVEQGDDFSVVVKLSTPGYDFPIPIEDSNSLQLTDQASSAGGQSFVSTDGRIWQDLKDIAKYSSANVCLKAFANSTSSEPEMPLEDEGDKEDPVDEGSSGGGGGGGGCQVGCLPLTSLLLMAPLLCLKARGGRH
ncbi:MAG: hypothetical protein JW971_03575 [Synergistales bacterium]|nr:hypothetical protein [Synergistales bacterium]